MKKKLLALAIGIVVFLGIFMFIQVWFEMFSHQTIWKVILSCLIILMHVLQEDRK